MVPLCKMQYGKLEEILKTVSNNHLFARSVVEGLVDGCVFVDNTDHPRTFYVLHPYGMSLLVGDSNNMEFNEAFKKYALNESNNRHKVEWMQVFPHDWDVVLKKILRENLVAPGYLHKSADTVELNTRVNFKFCEDKFRAGEKRNHKTDTNAHIVRTDKDTYMAMEGTVVPLHFWKNADQFMDKGVAFSLFYNGRLASTAFAACIHDDKLELGIETYEDFKGKGLAYKVCSSLINYCLQNGFEPVWACKRDNEGSYQLALKLGFENVKEISYYRLGF